MNINELLEANKGTTGISKRGTKPASERTLADWKAMLRVNTKPMGASIRYTLVIGRATVRINEKDFYEFPKDTLDAQTVLDSLLVTSGLDDAVKVTYERILATAKKASDAKKDKNPK
jgi:hypothetical protein